MEGSPAGGLYRTPGMPGFGGKASNDEIASMANFVRVRFGGHETSTLTGEDVARAMAPDEAPALLAWAPVLAWIGVVVALLAIGFIIWLILRRCGLAGRRHTVKEA